MEPVIKPQIFKAYDIRAIYPEELNQKGAEIIGRAVSQFFRQKEKIGRKLRITVGRDNRFSSPALFSGLKKGILSEGEELIDIGLSPTPLLYFSVWSRHYDAGIQITASHNPSQYNGFKIVDKEANIIGINSGLMKIKEIALKMLDKKEKSFPGILKKEKLINDYVEFNLKELKNAGKLKKLKIVIDTGNAVPGVMVSELKKRLSCKIIHLFPELDGNFPHHGLNPLEKENIKYLEKEVKEQKADLGVAFDGDGDRIVFVDEKGKTIPTDFITSLMAKIVLKEEKGKFVYNVCSSNIIRDTVLANGGVPVIWKIGHTFMKEKSKKENAVFGGEYSGHYLLRSHKFCEAPLYVLFKILEEMGLSGKSITELTQPFKKYFYSGVVNFEVKNKEKKMEKIEKKYQKGKISHLDGIRIDFPDWWTSVRPSNTEDLLRVVVEANSQSLMKEKIKEITKIISEK